MTTDQAATRPEELTPQRQGVPDDPIILPTGWLACWACGVAVQSTEPALLVEPQGRLGQEYQPISPPRMEVEFGHCAACRAIGERAQQMVAAQPLGWLAARGDQTSIAYQVEAGLHALDVLGAADQNPSLDLLLRHLARPGGSARWSARFFPMIEAEARPDSCSPYPWAHVRLGQRAALRDGYARLLQARLAATRPAVALPPPRHIVSGDPAAVNVQGGCLLCGTGRVMAPAARVALLDGPAGAASTLWYARVVPGGAGQLGGQPGPEMLAGYCCPPCEAAVDWVGAAGISAMERALDAHLRRRGEEELAGRMDREGWPGVVGWGAIYCAASRRGLPVPAGGTPWSHLDLSMAI